MPKDSLVLCVHEGYKYKSIKDIPNTEFALLNRTIVDSSSQVDLGKKFTQVIPLIIITMNDHYLVYTRAGSESRLHGKKSLTLGGHVDLEDVLVNSLKPSSDSYLKAIALAAKRELKEEVGLDYFFIPDEFSNIIYVPEDEVSTVHIGVVTILPIYNSKDLKQTDEIKTYEWVSQETMLETIDEYETWSQHIIKNTLDVD